MKRLAWVCWIVVLALSVAGCGGTQEFVAIPAGIDTNTVSRKVVRMTASDFVFTPDTIRVKAGTLIQLDITSVEGTHGFKLDAFGIDERLDAQSTKSIEFYVPRAGMYRFRCSHFCGLGHFGMAGTLIVE